MSEDSEHDGAGGEPLGPALEPFSCFEVHFHGTASQSNDLFSYLSGLSEMRRYQAIGDTLQYGTFNMSDPVVRIYMDHLTAERAALHDKLHALARLRIRSMGVEA